MTAKLRVFVSSVQKELEDERLIVQNLVNTDSFLSAHCVPVLYEFELLPGHLPRARRRPRAHPGAGSRMMESSENHPTAAPNHPISAGSSGVRGRCPFPDQVERLLDRLPTFYGALMCDGLISCAIENQPYCMCFSNWFFRRDKRSKSQRGGRTPPVRRRPGGPMCSLPEVQPGKEACA